MRIFAVADTVYQANRPELPCDAQADVLIPRRARSRKDEKLRLRFKRDRDRSGMIRPNESLWKKEFRTKDTFWILVED